MRQELITLKQEEKLRIRGKPFYQDTLYAALENALAFVGKDGHVASMPFLSLNFPHANFYTANSEELIGIDEEGLYAPRGEPVVVTYHGGGIFANHPTRIRQAYKEKLTPEYGAKLSPLEFKHALRGNVLDGFRKAPVYNYLDFLEDSKSSTFIYNNPVYGVVRRFEDVKLQGSGYQNIDYLRTNTQLIIYAGGLERAMDILERVGNNKLGVWHPFTVEKFNFTQAQGRLLFLNSNPFLGFAGNYIFYNGGNFVGILSEVEITHSKSLS